MDSNKTKSEEQTCYDCYDDGIQAAIKMFIFTEEMSQMVILRRFNVFEAHFRRLAILTVCLCFVHIYDVEFLL